MPRAFVVVVVAALAACSEISPTFTSRVPSVTTVSSVSVEIPIR